MATDNEFIGYIVAETQRAYLFQDHYWTNPDWMPKSQVETLRDDETHEVRLRASGWISEQKGIQEFQYRAVEALD
jgi:hypothetical protein